MCETGRIFNRKMWMLILVAVLGNICLYVYGQLGGRSVSDMVFGTAQYRMLVERYKDMELSDAADRAGREYSDIRKYARSLENERPGSMQQDMVMPDIIIKDSGQEEKSSAGMTSQELWQEADAGSREMIGYHQGLNETQQAQLELQMKKLTEKLRYLGQYEASVEGVVANAESMKKFGIFSKKDSFSYSNILRTARDFERVRDVRVSLDNDLAADSFVHYNIMYYIGAALMLVIIYAFFDERENGMWQLVHDTRGGRALLAVRRVVLISVAAFIIHALLYAATFTASLILYGGAGDLSGPVQTISDFGKFTYTLSKGGYILRLFFLSWFTLSVFGVALWSLFTVFRNRNHTLTAVAVFTGVQILLYRKIETQSVYSAFHYVNVVSFLRISDLYSTYVNWGFGSFVVPVFSLVMFFLAALGITSAAAGILRYERMKPVSGKTPFSGLSDRLHGQYQRLFAGYPMVIKELHKMVITGKSLWAVAVLVVLSVYFSSTGRMTFTDYQKEYDRMYLEHGGSSQEYIRNYVKEKDDGYLEALEKLGEAAVLYENGEIGMEEYIRASGAVQYQARVQNTVREYRSRLAYADHIREKYGKDIWLVSDRGYEEIFGQYSVQRELILIMALITAIMIVVSECMAMEYRTGMHAIIHSGAEGRRPVLVRKTAACIIFTVGLTVTVYGIDYFYMYRYYGMPYLSAPALSLSFLEDTWAGVAAGLTIGGYIVVLVTVRLVTALAAMTAAMCISGVIGRKGSRALMPVVLVIFIMGVWLVHSATGLV